MDFSFTDDQEALAALARQILTDRVTHEYLTELEGRGGERIDPELYRALAEADLLGVALPEEDGGLGRGLVDQCLVLREIGRTLAPVPVGPSLVTGALPIARFGTGHQRARWVRPAAEGRAVLTAALAEPYGRSPQDLATTAERADGGWRLTGVKTGVPAGTLADVVLVPARAEGRPALFLVEPGAAGVTVEAQRTTNFDTAARITLDGAAVGPDALLGGDAGLETGAAALDWLAQHATVALCAQQLGVVERSVEMIAEYTTNRVQFERPIATFQAVGHRAADAYIDAEAIRLTLWQAAWNLEAGRAAGLEVATAKLWAAEGGHRVAHALVHLHGGMGVAREYPAHRYFVHAKQIELMLGGATEQALRIGAALAS
ncbi:MAG TPA: acyl-CoA dehydrogenase family protein [Acidimicrobiales bacterium]